MSEGILVGDPLRCQAADLELRHLAELLWLQMDERQRALQKLLQVRCAAVPIAACKLQKLVSRLHVQGLMLRRTKLEVLGDILLAKTDLVVFCKLTPLQTRVYECAPVQGKFLHDACSTAVRGCATRSGAAQHC